MQYVLQDKLVAGVNNFNITGFNRTAAELLCTLPF